MVPQRFMLLEELPLNHSGKVDKAKLPKPGEKPERLCEQTKRLPKLSVF